MIHTELHSHSSKVNWNLDPLTFLPSFSNSSVLQAKILSEAVVGLGKRKQKVASMEVKMDTSSLYILVLFCFVSGLKPSEQKAVQPHINTGISPSQ